MFVNIHASPSEYRNEDVIIVAATDITELVEKDSQLIQASKMTNLEKDKERKFASIFGS